MVFCEHLGKTLHTGFECQDKTAGEALTALLSRLTGLPTGCPLLKGRKAGFADRLAVVLHSLVEQPVAHQQVDTALTNLHRCDHGYTLRAAVTEPFDSDGGWENTLHLINEIYRVIN